jgi:hypothetical protein
MKHQNRKKGVRVSTRSLGWQTDESLSSALEVYLTKKIISMASICETIEHTESVSGLESFAYVVYRDIS